MEGGNWYDWCAGRIILNWILAMKLSKCKLDLSGLRPCALTNSGTSSVETLLFLLSVTLICLALWNGNIPALDADEVSITAYSCTIRSMHSESKHYTHKQKNKHGWCGLKDNRHLPHPTGIAHLLSLNTNKPKRQRKWPNLRQNAGDAWEWGQSHRQWWLLL
jgi:hypothetical protein